MLNKTASCRKFVVADQKNTAHEVLRAMKIALKYSPFIKKKLSVLVISTTWEKLHAMVERMPI